MLQRKDIVVVSKNINLIDFLTVELAPANIEVHGAFDERRAEQFARSFHPQLIVVDDTPPSLESTSVVSNLKNDSEAQRSQIVILGDTSPRINAFSQTEKVPVVLRNTTLPQLVSRIREFCY